eukprot:PITA_28538
MNWQNFRQLKGQSVQDYTQEFRRRALLLGVDLQTQETLLNYIGGFHSYLRHTILMFNPTSLDEVCVQATHLEARGKKTFEEGRNKPAKGKNKEKTSKGKGKMNASIKQESEKVICKHYCKLGQEEKNYWKLHPEKRPQFNKSKGKQKTAATTSTPQDLGDDSGDETKITAMGLKKLKGKEMEIQASTSTSNCHVQAPNEEERIELFHDANLQVSIKCTLRFAITTHFIDTVELDVVPFDIAGIVLGSPYFFDRKSTFHRHENKYHLSKDGKEFIVRSHRKKTNIAKVNARQVKRLVNSSKNFVLLMIKPKVDVNHESFDNCDPKLESDMYDVVDVYHEIFQEPIGLPPKREIQHEIHLHPDCPLPNIGMYCMSIMENVEIKKQIKDLLDKGFIRPSTSPCGSPIVLILKKDGTWRMCVEFRALNKITVKNRYPLPRIDDLLDQLKNDRYFTKLDLRSGYHQVRIEESVIWKIAFKTKQGLFEWLVMLFGLCNAPATFMRVMDDKLRPFLDDFVIVYLDDILIFSKSREDHVMHVRKVLDVLKKNQLFLKMSKCEFGKTSLVYLGHIVGGGALRIGPAKIEAIVKWPAPKSITEVRIFFGAA